MSSTMNLVAIEVTAERDEQEHDAAADRQGWDEVQREKWIATWDK